MAKTMQELMLDLGFESEPVVTKTASDSNTSEINQILADLGLNDDAAAVGESMDKVASQEGKDMNNYKDIYNTIFGEEATEVTPQAEDTTSETTKVASEEGGDDLSPLGAFSSLTGVYFGTMHGACLEKVAGNLETEAGAGYDPLPEQASGSLTGVIGKPKDPQMPVNYKPDADKPLDVATKNTSPYTFAAVQAYLKRIGGKEALVGGYKD